MKRLVLLHHTLINTSRQDQEAVHAVFNNHGSIVLVRDSSRYIVEFLPFNIYSNNLYRELQLQQNKAKLPTAKPSSILDQESQSINQVINFKVCVGPSTDLSEYKSLENI